jgi:large subunit ribosomal protein L17
MRHRVDGRKLGIDATHRKAVYRNLVIALITHERIKTTTPRAKEARRLAERMITFAKRGDLHARRHVASILNDKNAVRKLFDELGPRYADRPGGFTRVLKLSGVRKGDAAEMSLLEFVKDGERPKKKRASSKTAAKAGKSKRAKAPAKAKAKSKAESKKEEAEAVEAVEAKEPIEDKKPAEVAETAEVVESDAESEAESSDETKDA